VTVDEKQQHAERENESQSSDFHFHGTRTIVVQPFSRLFELKAIKTFNPLFHTAFALLGYGPIHSIKKKKKKNSLYFAQVLSARQKQLGTSHGDEDSTARPGQVSDSEPNTGTAE
jgi:hypothetical protein